MIEDQKQYYDTASTSYSETRYIGPLRTYTQFVFRKRLSIFLKMMEHVAKPDFSLFEIGCADGIIVGNVLEKFPNVGNMVGIDVSPEMIEKARSINKDPRFSFFLRNEEPQEKYDVVIELGVHTENLEDEIRYVKSHLKENGYYIYSHAGQKSIYARIKLKDKEYLKQYKPYHDLEAILSKHFEIIESKGYGLFIPKLWSVPVLGRFILPIAEALFSPFQELFHEKIYLLKNKN